MSTGWDASEALSTGLAVAVPALTGVATGCLALGHKIKGRNVTEAVQYGSLKDGEHYFLAERPTFKDNEYIKGSVDDDAEGLTDKSMVYKGRSVVYAPASSLRNFEQ